MHVINTIVQNAPTEQTTNLAECYGLLYVGNVLRLESAQNDVIHCDFVAEQPRKLFAEHPQFSQVDLVSHFFALYAIICTQESSCAHLCVYAQATKKNLNCSEILTHPGGAFFFLFFKQKRVHRNFRQKWQCGTMLSLIHI